LLSFLSSIHYCILHSFIFYFYRFLFISFFLIFISIYIFSDPFKYHWYSIMFNSAKHCN
jgi:hypothetical protein